MGQQHKRFRRPNKNDTMNKGFVKLDVVQRLRKNNGVACSISETQRKLQEAGYYVTEATTAELVNRCMLAEASGLFKEEKK